MKRAARIALLVVSALAALSALAVYIIEHHSKNEDDWRNRGSKRFTQDFVRRGNR